MNQNAKGLRIKSALLLFGMLPLIAITLALSIYSFFRLKEEVTTETFNKLEVAARSVDEYFHYDLVANGCIDYDEYSDHEYIESCQKMDIEMTLFENNIRFLTSLKNADGTYNEGSAAGAGIWDTVSAGNVYTASDVVIGGKSYFVYYVPIYDGNNKVWGMGFAGTPQSNVTSLLRSSVIQLIIITLIIVAVFIAIIIAFASKIYNAMIKASDTLSELAEGNMNVSTENSSNILEIAMIINATSNLKHQLTESAGGAKTTATDLNHLVENVDNLAAQSSKDATSIANSMSELSLTAQSLAETVQDANASVIDMGEAISSISDKAQNSAQDAEGMRTVNKQVASVIANVKVSNEKSVEAIKQIGILTTECKQAVESIKTAADEITSIASQTNLLALNASIESARAGEAGRGFSVVAENIKNLASGSADSSAGISSRVSDIIVKVDKCVEAAEAAAAIMQEQNKLVTEAGESMDLLSESVGNVADNIAVITDEAKRLDTAKNSVLNNISDLSAISEENAASSEQVSTSVGEVSHAIEGVKTEANRMHDLAVELEAKMEFFKI